MTAYLKTACDHGPVEKVPADGRLRARLRRLMERDRERAVHWPDGFAFASPAEGDGYDFSVKVQFLWCVTGIASVEGLIERAKENHPALRDRLLTRVRSVSRTVAPYEAATAEARISRIVEDVFAEARFEYRALGRISGTARTIEPHTVVKPDEAVRKAQQAAWDRRQRTENDHALAERLVPLLTERRELWQAFLESGQSRWATPYAVTLAEKSEGVGAAVQEMFEERRRQARELTGLVTEQAEEYEDVNAFELMIRNDTVLRRLMDLMGIDRPAELAPAPFGTGEQARWSAEPRWNGEARP
ncbi:hypothetical protein [Actinomadura nitritigenes]|uniref:hypothetical protein n=1 Tax=Actinomadura nitritigenes TaxID=134602 RepID=UPI003D93B850